MRAARWRREEKSRIFLIKVHGFDFFSKFSKNDRFEEKIAKLKKNSGFTQKNITTLKNMRGFEKKLVNLKL